MAYKRRIKTGSGIHTTYPLKDKKDMEMITNYFLLKRERSNSKVKIKQADRNWMMCLLGFNTAFRAEDLLQLKVRDLENGSILIRENKTGKPQHFKMNKFLYDDIQQYIERNKLTSHDYIFYGQKSDTMSITRQQANRVLIKAAKEMKLKSKLSMHTLRKSFAYHFIKNGGNILTLQKMLNHESPEVTMLYICWETNDAEIEREGIYNAGTHRKGGRT